MSTAKWSASRPFTSVRATFGSSSITNKRKVHLPLRWKNCRHLLLVTCKAHPLFSPQKPHLHGACYLACSGFFIDLVPFTRKPFHFCRVLYRTFFSLSPVHWTQQLSA